jgi:hypothetical protein
MADAQHLLDSVGNEKAISNYNKHIENKSATDRQNRKIARLEGRTPQRQIQVHKTPQRVSIPNESRVRSRNIGTPPSPPTQIDYAKRRVAQRQSQNQTYRSQSSYGGLNRENLIGKTRKVYSPDKVKEYFDKQGNVTRVVRTPGKYIGTKTTGLVSNVIKNRPRLLSDNRKRMPGSPAVRVETSGRVSQFVTGKRQFYQSQGYAKPGRPKGSYYKYTIPGVGPVDVFTWRKWNRNQQRLLAAKLQAQSPGLSYNEARQALKQTMPSNPQFQQQARQIPQQVQQMQPQAQQYPQQAYPQPQQMQQPVSDGWDLLRVRSPLTLGTGTQMQRPVEPVMGVNAQGPIGNKFTNYFSEPDFLSGRQVMRTRPNAGGFGLW